MFNFTLTGNARVWFDDLPKESIDNYDDLRKGFLENYLQQKKCIKDPVEIHNIKQRDGESTEEFVRMYKLECRDQEARHKQNFKKGSFRSQQRTERKQDIFTLQTKTPKEILALDKGEFKPPPPMTTPLEKRNASKFCEFHREVGHTTDECMHLKRQIEEMLKAGKLSHLIKELKQNNGKEQAKAAKKGEAPAKDKALAILMVQLWQKIARQRITQTFSPESVISFPPLGEEDETKGPMIIEAEMGGHCVHRMYVDRGSSSKILYEHCFNRFRPEVKNQMVPATTPLVGFNGEIIWPLGQISLLVKIGDEEHSTFAWMNFMIVRSSSPYNGIIGRPEVRKIRAIPSTAHEMLKFPVIGRIVTRTGLSTRLLVGFQNQKPLDMTGVLRHIAEHRLNIREGCLLVRQNKRGQAPENNKAICKEVEKLVDAGIMKEVHYHNWLSNPVMVKKTRQQLENVCRFQRSKQSVPQRRLPITRNRLEGGVPLRIPFQMLPGCIQRISLNKNGGRGRGENSVHNKSRNTLLFKNAARTEECWSNLPAPEKEVIRDIEETFRTLREINMKLNPKKCAFGMREGTLLGYKVDADGLRVCPDKVEAVLNLQSPRCLKDVQKLNGKLASLNRFLSKSAEKSLPFFKTLKNARRKAIFNGPQKQKQHLNK
ncbi:reverse transcriptase domain-containing protein [Tanacetum coccineum]